MEQGGRGWGKRDERFMAAGDMKARYFFEEWLSWRFFSTGNGLFSWGWRAAALSGPCSGGFSDGLMQEEIPYQMALFFKGEM